MGTSRRVRDRYVTPVRSANNRLKERWSFCLAWSMTGAAVAHLAVFAAWPTHEVRNRTLSPRLSITQLVPIAAPGKPPAPRDDSTTELPKRTERPLEETPALVEEETDDLLEMIDLPPPSLANLSPLANGHPELSLRTATLLAPASGARAAAGPAVPHFTWPQLRNSRAVVRFLRRNYNPVALAAVPERSVGVAMWINEKGVVEWCEVRESSGHPVVDQIALAVIREIAEFIPASRRGVPTPVAVVLAIPFEKPW